MLYSKLFVTVLCKIYLGFRADKQQHYKRFRIQVYALLIVESRIFSREIKCLVRAVEGNKKYAVNYR